MSKLGLPSLPSFANLILSALMTGYILLGETPNHLFINLVLSSVALAAIGPLEDLGTAVKISGSYFPIKSHNFCASFIGSNCKKKSSGNSAHLASENLPPIIFFTPFSKSANTPSISQ